ncbi:MAG: hypothetical protein ACYCX9_09005 [Candidatus Dormibacteria bacterium]
MSSQPDRLPEEDIEPVIPPVPRLTRTERAVWVVYAAVGIGLIVVPVATRSFSLPNLAAFVLLGGAVAMSYAWFRSGELRTAEWLPEAEYEEFLHRLHDPYEPPDDPD